MPILFWFPVQMQQRETNTWTSLHESPEEIERVGDESFFSPFEGFLFV
jgi:hypothetical protein